MKTERGAPYQQLLANHLTLEYSGEITNVSTSNELLEVAVADL
ncbi:hypothetical protein ES703_64171 [subsurface metagenome]